MQWYFSTSTFHAILAASKVLLEMLLKARVTMVRSRDVASWIPISHQVVAASSVQTLNKMYQQV